MDAINAARDWFFNTAVRYKLGENDKGKSVFVSLYTLPERKGQALVYCFDEPEAAWQQVEFAITNAQAAHQSFALYVSTVKNDPAAMRWPITMRAYDGSHSQASINGIGNAYPMPPQPSIGEIKKELEKEYAEKLERTLEIKALEDKVNGLSYELKAKKKSNGDFFDKLEGFAETTGLNLSDPQSIQAIGGILMGTLDKVLGAFKGAGNMQPIGVAGDPDASPRRMNGRAIYQQPAHAPVPTERPDDDPNNDPDEEESEMPYELDDQDNLALDAVAIMRESGCQNPGEILMKIAKFYASNPTMAEGFINQYLPA